MVSGVLRFENGIEVGFEWNIHCLFSTSLLVGFVILSVAGLRRQNGRERRSACQLEINGQ